MNPTILTLFALAGSAAAALAAPVPQPAEVKALATRVADWQIRTFDEHGKYRALASNKPSWANHKNYHDLQWHMGALYAGIERFRHIADQPEKYPGFLTMIGQRNGWKLHKRPYHADDHAVGQFYLSLYQETRDPAMLRPTREQFDWILEHPKTGSIVWTTWQEKQAGKHTDCHDRWGWCDALFMAPPVWARLAKITGERKYLDFMDREYHATYDLLWDKNDHFFWRDSSFFPKREKNGRKLYWGRGNGWVFGGLALMIPDLPQDWQGRPFYLQLFRQMADSLLACQRDDGTWSMGLLGGTDGYPNKETSGTAFFTFGLAWGINNGILDKEKYQPATLKAWQALAGCVTPDGMVGWVQPVGAAPGISYPDKTEVYGTGAFLAAASEVYQLAGANKPSPHQP